MTVKKYHDEIRVYCENELVCVHKRIFGKDNMAVDIMHYLMTLERKPGALRNSVALKSIPKLEAIFDTRYANEPKKFIEILQENRGLSTEKLVKLFEEKTSNKISARIERNALSITGTLTESVVAARADMSKYAVLVYKAGAGRQRGCDTKCH